jgi:hypothetical protein
VDSRVASVTKHYLRSLARTTLLLAALAGCENERTLPGVDGGAVDLRAEPDQYICSPGLPGSWAVSVKGTRDTFAFGLAVATDGQLIGISGKLLGKASFGPSVVGIDGDKSDAFIALADGTGRFVWATGIADDTGSEYIGRTVAMDPAGDLVAVGYAGGAAVFGTIRIPDGAGYVARVGPSGTFRWVTTIGKDGSFGDAARVALDPTGNVYVAGLFRQSPTPLGSLTLSCHAPGPGEYPFHGFVGKLDEAGNALWAAPICITGKGMVMPSDVSVDASGNSYVVGGFIGSITIGEYSASATVMQTGGFVARFDAAGNPSWLVPVTGQGFAAPSSIAVDGSGNSYVAGWATDTATIGSTKVGLGGFLARLDPKGDVSWVIELGAGATPGGIALSPGGHVVAVLNATEDVTAGGKTFEAAEPGAPLLLQVTPQGRVLSGVRAGVGDTLPAEVVFDRAGNAYVAGTFRGTAWFGCTELTATHTSPFIWKAGAVF